MPRKPRKKSSTGIYHVMLRGINGQDIFKDDEDRQRFIQTIGEYKEVSKYEIYAYCLMSNHIHILIKENSEELGIIFRRIGASYVYWYNEKYKRRGHLFQDRFRSEPVEDDTYFLTVLRYIHQNPVKAGIVKDIEQYFWSSYNEYIGKDGFCDIEFVLNIFSENNKEAIKKFRKFTAQENNDKCLEYEEKFKIDDEEAMKLIERLTGIKDPRQIQKLEKEERNRFVKEFKNIGLSIRQIERLTGISFSIIRRI